MTNNVSNNVLLFVSIFNIFINGYFLMSTLFKLRLFNKFISIFLIYNFCHHHYIELNIGIFISVWCATILIKPLLSLIIVCI